MDAEKILKLSPAVLGDLLALRRVSTMPKAAVQRRGEERWPFPGTVEVWLPDQCYGDRHLLATLHNLSQSGLAMRTRRVVPTDTRISLAIHQPEMSCYGDAIVRHCTRAPVGYLVGVEFLFSSDAGNDEA